MWSHIVLALVLLVQLATAQQVGSVIEVPDGTPCKSELCSNHGNCTVISYYIHCYCEEGWLGHYCNEKDACGSSPCKNGGTCVYNPFSKSKKHNFKCYCPDNWTGKTCHKPRIPPACCPNPCRNNGICELATTKKKHGDGKVFCVCPPGFTGGRCQKERKQYNCTENNPCASGSTCEPTLTRKGVRCVCDPFHEGEWCKKTREVKKCIDRITGENYLYEICGTDKGWGVCNDDNGLICHCEDGWEGDHCHDPASPPCNVTELASVKACYGRGFCKVVAGEPHCMCDRDYVGGTCSDYLKWSLKFQVLGIGSPHN